MWAVIVSEKGGYSCYAILATEDEARHWAKCLEHGGADTALCRIDRDMLVEAAEAEEK
jgi:hypothetical protein